MAVRLRLTRVGGKKDPIWRVVVADQRSPRDGRFIETVGQYNPQTEPSTIRLNEERIREWLSKGAQPTPQVRKLLKTQGIDAAARQRRRPRCATCPGASRAGPPRSPRRARSSSSRRTTARSSSSSPSPR